MMVHQLLSDECSNSNSNHCGDDYDRVNKRARFMISVNDDNNNNNQNNTVVTAEEITTTATMNDSCMVVDPPSPPVSLCRRLDCQQQQQQQQQTMPFPLATLFPLTYFVAKLDCGRLLLKCQFCRHFEHCSWKTTGTHQPLVSIPIESDHEIEHWYNNRLNAELNHHLGTCLDCSAHKIRHLGSVTAAAAAAAAAATNNNNSSTKTSHCSTGHYQILSRFVYHHLQQQQQQQFATTDYVALLPHEQLVQCQQAMKGQLSERDVVNIFIFPTL